MGKIKGYLHIKNGKIVNGADEEIILTGWGLGNWLLPEGYMWLSGSECFDRPRRIEKVLVELTGKDYADNFWKTYRDTYIQRADIDYMAALGYNSVRIPVNWRLLMEAGEGVVWKADGFALLDRCIQWCEEAGIYAFLDLHGAPGGQTGANIDDSMADAPMLFLDADCREKGLCLWEKLAARYAHREAVGGYDLLNEPIAPPRPGKADFDGLIPEVMRFYKDAAARIRQVDPNHMLSLEGVHWATDVRIFNEKLDDHMVIHFHRYAEPPERKCLEDYLNKSEELNLPLWLGESGENVNEWYAALYPLAMAMGIGINLWTWKKMDCTNSPCSITAPAEYGRILDYVNGGGHPGVEKAQQIFDEYLHNIRFENCTLNPAVTRHVFRQLPFSLRAVDFDELPGRGVSFGGSVHGNTRVDYRSACGMELVELEPIREPAFAFDSQWDRYGLMLHEGDFVCYSFSGGGDVCLTLEVIVKEMTVIHIVSGKNVKEIVLKPEDTQAAVTITVPAGQRGSVTVVGIKGTVCLKRLVFDKG